MPNIYRLEKNLSFKIITFSISKITLSVWIYCSGFVNLTAASGSICSAVYLDSDAWCSPGRIFTAFSISNLGYKEQTLGHMVPGIPGLFTDGLFSNWWGKKLFLKREPLAISFFPYFPPNKQNALSSAFFFQFHSLMGYCGLTTSNVERSDSLICSGRDKRHS